jgi:GGDEF domain-containing protein
MSETIDPDHFWLGAFIGAQLLIVCFCVIRANAYRERALLLHGAATLLAVLAVQALIGTHPVLPGPIFLLVLAFSGMQLLDMVSHAGALRRARRWLVGVSAVAVPVLAAASVVTPWAMAVALVLWAAVVVSLLARAWPQSQPWIGWLLPGTGALLVAGVGIVLRFTLDDVRNAMLEAGLLTLWSASVYIAAGWRGRIFGETRARINARNRIDPLTGLATPLVLGERVHAARNLMIRYGHPSVLMLVHIENLGSIADEFGPETAESAVLAAADRVRASMRNGDVAARLTHSRIAVLTEGLAPPEAAANVASRILVAGLKDPLPAAPAEFLRFRIVLAPVPAEDIPAKLLLHRMGFRLDQELQASSERRIATIAHDELLQTQPSPL